MSVISDFTNENFRVLSYMVSIRKNDNGVYVTQQEIADAIHLSRVSINKIFSDLKSGGYITQDQKHRGRYYLPEKSIEIVNAIMKANEIK